MAKRTSTDPTGRLDILAMKVLDRIVEMKASPLAKDIYHELRPELELVCRANLGPHNEPMRKLRNMIRQSAGPRPPKIGVRRVGDRERRKTI